MAKKGRRAEAQSRGEKQYFTGAPCKRGHIAARDTASGSCIACRTSWAAENPEKRKAICRKYRERNPNQSREWKEANPERVKQKMKEWRTKNVHRIGSYYGRRRALQQNAAVGDRKAYIAYVAWARSAAGLCCVYCLKPVAPENRHLDHVIPLSRGGADSVENLCVACQPCNQQKNAKTLEEFSQHQQRLRDDAVAAWSRKLHGTQE